MSSEDRQTQMACCLNCEHFAQTSPVDGARDLRSEGHCRVNPPIIVPQKDLNWGQWPMVKGSSLCGQFSPVR